MALERGLGKGLGALLGDAALQSQEGGSLSLPISQVEPGLKQPRKRFDEESLQDLADSIRIHGIIQPLTVRRLSSGYYQIIAGERRWRAAKLAGLSEIPAVIIEADDRKVMELTGVKQIDSFDSSEFLLETAQGWMVIQGKDLTLGKLDTERGDVVIRGVIEALSYVSNKKGNGKESVISKIFK